MHLGSQAGPPSPKVAIQRLLPHREEEDYSMSVACVRSRSRRTGSSCQGPPTDPFHADPSSQPLGSAADSRRALGERSARRRPTNISSGRSFSPVYCPVSRITKPARDPRLVRARGGTGLPAGGRNRSTESDPLARGPATAGFPASRRSHRSGAASRAVRRGGTRGKPYPRQNSTAGAQQRLVRASGKKAHGWPTPLPSPALGPAAADRPSRRTVGSTPSTHSASTPRSAPVGVKVAWLYVALSNPMDAKVFSCHRLGRERGAMPRLETAVTSAATRDSPEGLETRPRCPACPPRSVLEETPSKTRRPATPHGAPRAASIVPTGLLRQRGRVARCPRG